MYRVFPKKVNSENYYFLFTVEFKIVVLSLDVTSVTLISITESL